MNVLRNFKCGAEMLNSIRKSVFVGFVSAPSFLSKPHQLNGLSQSRTLSLLTNMSKLNRMNSLTLTSNNIMIIPSCGMKVKGKLQLRCKHCYYTRIDGRMYVLCDSYPRHKQMASCKREKYTWILSHCSQSKKRPY